MMKRIQYLIPAFMCLMLFTSTLVMGQYTFGTTEVSIAADDADNYSGGWNETMGGTGFSDWVFDTSSPNGGFTGRFIGGFSTALDVNSNSFGLYANSGNDATSGATLTFPKTLHTGDSFTISVGVNYRDGVKGFDIRNASNASEFNFLVENDTYKLNGVDLFSNAYDANTVITFTFTQNETDVSWAAERTGGTTASQSGTISSITSGTLHNIRLFNVSAGTNGDDGGARNLYFNSLEFKGKHVVPSGESVTLAEDTSVPYLLINSGGTFTASDATPRTLTIANSASGSQATFTNNGTWANGTGGSTVVFTGAPSSGDTQHEIAGSSSTAFQNVTINKTAGTSNVGSDFQTGTSVTGTLRIGSGGYVATAPPSSFYGSSAILDFNQGASADYAVNNGDNSWSTTEVPNNITITTGTVTLNEARTLTGELLIESGATLVTNGNFNLASGGVLSNNGTVTGDINFLTNLTDSAGFRMLSSPVSSTYSDLLDAVWTQGATTGADVTNGDPNVFTWDKTSTDDANTNWTGVTDLSGSLVAGNGLLAYIYADDDYDGSDDAFPKTLSVTGTENAVDAAPTLNANVNGWTLVGNPFATTIDFDDATKIDLTDVAYIWDPNSGSGAWKSWNGNTGDITDGLIPSFQGFFVQNNGTAASPSITFGAASKSTGGTFLGKANTNQAAKVRLEVSGENLSNSMWLQFSEEGSASTQVMGDAVELQSLNASFAELASLKGAELFDIAHLPITEEVNLPISFKTTESGVYTLTADNFEMPSSLSIEFHDYETGKSMTVDENFSYEFEATAIKSKSVPPLKSLQQGPILAKANNENRFGLVILSKAVVSNEVKELPSVFALEQNYPNPFNPTTTVKYSVAKAGEVQLTVYNMMGQKVANLVNGTKQAGSYAVTWNAEGMASGMYFYRLSAAGQTMTRQMTLIK